jgi:hypothetical protein
VIAQGIRRKMDFILIIYLATENKVWEQCRRKMGGHTKCRKSVTRDYKTLCGPSLYHTTLYQKLKV